MYYLLYNPVAGRGRAAKKIQRVLDLFEQSGKSYTVLTTEYGGHGIDLVRETPEDSIIVAVGGDGTVQETLRGMVEADGFPNLPEGYVTSRRLGVVPLGSGDDFAFARGIDRFDVDRATEQVLTGSEHRVDFGIMNGRPFSNSFGIGFDAASALEATKAPHMFKGLASYLYGVSRALRQLEAKLFTVHIDGELVYEGNSLLVSTQNGPRTGGSFLFTPDAKNDDGVFEVVVAGDFNRIQTVVTLPKVLSGKHVGHPKIYFFRGTNVEITVSSPVPGHLEGELLEPETHFTARMVPLGLRVVH